MRCLHLADDSLDCRRRQVDRQLRLDHKDAALGPRPLHLQARQRAHQNLTLVWVPVRRRQVCGYWWQRRFDLQAADGGSGALADPADVRATVGHAQHALVHDPRLGQLAACVAGGDGHALRGGHEAGLDATAATILVRLPERVGQLAARHTAIDDARVGELAGLDDGRVDAVQRGRILVEVLERLGV